VTAQGGQTRKKDLLLDLYLPAGAKGKVPVIVWIHGGAWAEGTKGRLWIPWITGEGYAVASIDYRVSGEAAWPAQIHDCKAAVRWLRANAARYNLDPARIGAAGDSAGGHLVAMLAVTGGVKDFEGDLGNADQSSAVAGVIDFFGPADLPELISDANVQAGLDGNENRRVACAAVSRLNGGMFPDLTDPAKAAALRAKAKASSPTTYASKDDVPLLIVHGDADPLVPVDQSRRLYKALKDVGAPVTLAEIPRGQHGAPFSDYYDSPEAKKRILAFFDEHVKNAKPAPTTAPAAEPTTMPVDE
jgi:acetyl esterase/lipase